MPDALGHRPLACSLALKKHNQHFSFQVLVVVHDARAVDEAVEAERSAPSKGTGGAAPKIDAR